VETQRRLAAVDSGVFARSRIKRNRVGSQAPAVGTNSNTRGWNTDEPYLNKRSSSVTAVAVTRTESGDIQHIGGPGVQQKPHAANGPTDGMSTAARARVKQDIAAVAG
jgi:hypothetical protein